MNRQEGTPEIAEKAASNKVVNIFKHPLFKHSFVRFGPLTDTVKEEWAQWAPSKEQINPNIDRLSGIFNYGLISRIFADRISLDYSCNFSDPKNLDAISVATPTSKLCECFGYAINGAAKWSPNIKIPVENIFLLLISNNLLTVSILCDGEVDVYERLVKYRIPQRFFQGIVIVDGKIAPDSPEYGIPCQETINWTNLDPKFTTSLVIDEMLKSPAYIRKPELAVPIYGCSGILYWPKI